MATLKTHRELQQLGQLRILTGDAASHANEGGAAKESTRGVDFDSENLDISVTSQYNEKFENFKRSLIKKIRMKESYFF